MTTAILVLLVLILTVSVVNLFLSEYRTKKIWLRYAILQDEMSKMDKHLITAGKILQIYEDETKILERRKNQQEVKSRFTRQPR